MVGNQTFFFSQDTLSIIQRIFIQYMFQGLLLAATNVLILAAVNRTFTMRTQKAYIFVAGLALIDFILGLILISMSAFRNLMIEFNWANVAISPFQCMIQPWNLAAQFKDAVYGPMMLVQSLDRVFAVGFPTRYYTWTTQYAFALCTMPYIFGFLYITPYVCHACLHHEKILPLICSSYDPVRYTWPSWLQVLHTIEISMTTGSVLLYVLVVIILANKKPLAANNQAQNNFMRRQRHLTVTVGITCLFTLLLHTSTRFVSLLRMKVGGRDKLSQLLFGSLLQFWDVNEALIRHMNPCLNVFIYTVKQREMRIAIRYLLRCKELTEMQMQQEMNTMPTGTRSISNRHKQSVRVVPALHKESQV